MNTANTRNKLDYLFVFYARFSHFYHLYVISQTYKGFSIYSFPLASNVQRFETLSEDVGVQEL